MKALYKMTVIMSIAKMLKYCKSRNGAGKHTMGKGMEPLIINTIEHCKGRGMIDMEKLLYNLTMYIALYNRHII